MKASTVKEIKSELTNRSHSDLIKICLDLSKFKKENKELLTYLLFEKHHEEGFIQSIKDEIDSQFELINTTSYYFIKKSVRKILRMIKKYIRYSKKKETEVALLLYFCEKLKVFQPSIQNNNVLMNIFNREIGTIKKKLLVLHEDLQYDYNVQLEALSF